MDIIEHLGVNAIVEAFLRHALNEFSFFVVDDQSAVGTMHHVSSTDCNLWVNLPVSVHGSVENKQTIDDGWISALHSLRTGGTVIETCLSDGRDDFCSRWILSISLTMNLYACK